LGALERLNTAEVGEKSIFINDNNYESSDDDLNGGRSIIQEIDYKDKNKAG
jgi:hypothetical protein